MLPFALVQQLGWATIPANILVCLSFALISEAGRVLEDPFDYAAEDVLIERYRKAIESVEPPQWADGQEPGFGLAYSGPGGRTSSKSTFE